MSYKLNKKHPDRRAKILERREPQHERCTSTYEDKYGKNTFLDFSPRYPVFLRHNATPMKQSNRRACMRRLEKRKKQFSEKVFKTLMAMIENGMAARHHVYGFHPTKPR